MLYTTVSQTTALIVSLTGLVAAIGSIIAAVLGTLNRRSLQTPSGPSIGQQVERAHLTAIANNLQLTAMNGKTTEAETSDLLQKGESPPQVPQE